MTTPTDYAALRKLAEAATPGPWKARQRDWGSPDYKGGPEKRLWELDDARGAQIAGATIHASNGTGDKDIAFIAAANPATVIALLDERAALRQERDDLIHDLGRLQEADSEHLAENAALQADARRMEYVRQHATSATELRQTARGTEYPTVWKIVTGVKTSDYSVDAAIDAALAQQTEQAK